MRRLTFTFPWPWSAEETRDLLSFAFQTALVTYLLLYFIESLKPGFVTNYFSLDTWLWAAIVTGVLSSVWPMVVSPAKKQKPRLRWRDYLWLALLAVGAAAVVYYKTQTIGWLSKIITPLAGLIVFGLSLLIYLDNDDRTGE